MSHSNAYVEAFLTKKPKEGIAIVQARLKDSMALDMELAEYFKERAQIEENYAKSLAKASKRLYTMDPAVLGHFAPIWELLLKEFNQVANFHTEMAYKISQEIEKPLRASPSDDYHKLQQMEPIIYSLENKKKLSSVKGSIFKKSSSSSKSLKSGTWENEGVEYLKLNQSIDEARLNRLKKSVEKFEQIQSDQLMKRVELANMTLSSAEVFDVQHDIRDFCTERGRGLTTLETQQQQQTSRPRASTMNSHDSQRSTTSSTNKFKSVFMKKKKQHSKLDEDNYQSQQEQQQKYQDFHNNNTSSTSEEHPSSNSIIISDQIVPSRNTIIPIAATSSPITRNIESPFSSQYNINNNNAPLVDAEGYSVPSTTGHFPTIASDISSRNTSDDLDSDYQSFKLNQRLQINIKDDVVKEEDNQANESFNKVANVLRERTPTITRKARGRRENSMIRSQTDSSIYSNTIYNDPSNNNSSSLRANSMLSISSNETSNSTPFLQQQQLQQPPPASPISVNFMSAYSSSPQQLQYSPVSLADPPMTSGSNSFQLQPILEDQQTPPEASVSIFEKTRMADEHHVLQVNGQVSITYTGPTNTPVFVHISHIEGIQQLTPNPQYITTDGDNYTLNTVNTPQGQPTVCFTYEVNLNGDGRWALPIRLSPSWKCVEGISYLMIKHGKNEIAMDKLKGNVQVFYDHVTSVQSTPQGTWDVNKKRLTWQMKDLFDQYEQQGQSRLLAKFFIEDGHVGTAQPIHLNYLVKDTLATGLSVQVVHNNQLIKQHIETSVQSENIVIF